MFTENNHIQDQNVWFVINLYLLNLNYISMINQFINSFLISFLIYWALFV